MTGRYSFPVVETVRVVDGDTYWLRLDVGFRQTQLTEIRLDGWDCPELHGSTVFEKGKAEEARDLAATFLEHPDVWVQTKPDPDSFGRWLGRIWHESDGLALGPVLAEAGLATQWPTRWHNVYGGE